MNWISVVILDLLRSATWWRIVHGRRLLTIGSGRRKTGGRGRTNKRRKEWMINQRGKEEIARAKIE